MPQGRQKTALVPAATAPARLSALDRALSVWRLALAVFGLTLWLYVYTLQPSLSWGDGTRLQREALTGESFIQAEMVSVQFAPDPLPFARLGVAAWDHPLYVVLGYAAARLLPSADPLWSINLVSALFGAATCALVFYLVARHSASRVAGLVAAASLALSHTFWFHSVTPEVYTLFTCLLLLAVACLGRFEATGRGVWLSAAAFAVGLAASNHLLAFLALPALVLYAWAARRAGQRRLAMPGPRELAVAGAAFLAGCGLYLVQLARMLRTFPPSQVMGPVVGDTFFRGLLSTTPLELLQSLLTYAVFLLLQFGPAGAALGVYGLVRGARLAPGLWRKAAALFLVYAVFGVLYRVADQFAFFHTSYVIWALLLGLGTAGLLARLRPAGSAWLLGGLAVLLALQPLVYALLPGAMRAAGLGDDALGIPTIGAGVRDGLAYYVTPNKRGDLSPVEFGRGTLASLPPDALVLAQWYTDTDEYFVLRYFAAVEGLRPDVEIVGWPTEDIFSFDNRMARDLIVAEASRRPVYLASLSQRYYDAAWLAQHYCIVVEHNLYRVYPTGAARQCLR